MERLVELLKTREYASLHHSFYTALPRITHAEIGEELKHWSTDELKAMQGEPMRGLGCDIRITEPAFCVRPRSGYPRGLDRRTGGAGWHFHGIPIG